jgi:cell division protein FtsI (penicillin-binding protein 3)
MPSEAPGILHKPGTDAWDQRTKEVVLFGQGVSVNALQAVSVYQTLANKGVRVPPRLIQGYKCPGKKEQVNALPKSKKVVSKKTAKKLIRMLESVVDEGTGKTAQIKNYRVAGKTGTSELIRSTGTTYLASFIGIAPADHPKYVLGIFIDNPQGTSWGSTNAAPVFQKVMQFALQTNKIRPSTTKAKPYPVNW